MWTHICNTYFTYSSMFENCFIGIIIYIYIISLKCGIQPQLQHTGSLSKFIVVVIEVQHPDSGHLRYTL
jgi:hypothetical protein